MSQRLAPGLCLALLALLLSACGFRLMGDRPLPELLDVVFIDVEAPYRVREPPVETHLRALLQRRGASIRTRSGDGVTAVRIQELNTVREVLSVGPDGKALEFCCAPRCVIGSSATARSWCPVTTSRSAAISASTRIRCWPRTPRKHVCAPIFRPSWLS